MNDNSTNATATTDLEAVTVDEAVDDTVGEATEEPGPSTAEPLYEQVNVPEETAPPPKKKVSLKDILVFAQKKIFTPKVCSIILISLGSLITATCLLQMVFWGLSVKDTYLNYWESIKTFDFINIIIMAFMALFVLVLFINTIKSIVSLIKKGHEVRFETVSTLFAFFLFSMFVTKLFGWKPLLISNFKFEPLLKIIVILVIAYAFVRLFVKDFGARICPFAFSCGTIAVSIVMFAQNVGNFASFTIGGTGSFQLADLNIYRYIQSAIAESNPTAITSVESIFFRCGTEIYIDGIDLNEEIFVVLLQFVPIMVSGILPYVAISLLGYLMFCLVSRNYVQYYNLQTCKKISISMLIVSILSLAATIGLYFTCKLTSTHLSVQLNYTNIVLTIVLCIVMIVTTSLPWKIYNAIYNRRYAAYKKIEGGN